ncbi:hypothetical protein M3Y99_01585000 [Aphelenchoides fujianensis]|nr:hypothetical protein M3Y99_01585000 [Aphelenchoides fujianensis]
MRLEIQGLRAIAVFYVLVYHLWDDVFPVGYLGVDVFFVISGFLMCAIVSKSRPMDGRKSVDFFFRRFKRLLPPYLFVVAAVLIAGVFLLAPTEFGTLAADGLNSAVFLSNYFGQGGRGYFDLYSEFKFLKHTWSLSAEVQFYLLVPLVFFLFDRLDRRNGRTKFGALGTISIVSFLLQVLADREAGHMALQCRLWQFFAGFFAFYSNSARLFDLQRAGQQPCVEDGKEEVESQRSVRFSEHVDAAINWFLFAALMLVLTFDLTTDSQMSLPAQLQTKATIERLYATRNSTAPVLSAEAASDVNMDVYAFSRQFYATEPFAPLLQKELHFGGDFRFFRQTQEEQRSYLNHVQERVDLISCSKCSKVDWSRAWCSNGRCEALDRRSIAYFRDSKHVNAYGSLVYGRLMREVYDRKE